MENFKLSRGARRKNLLQVDSLADGNVKAAVGTRRVEEILQRCYYLASKKGQDLHTLRKSLKEDEEKDASEKIARRLAAYFDSLSSTSDPTRLCSAGHDCNHVHGMGCSCFRIADWPALDPDLYSSIDRDSDSDDLTSELYSTVYLGGTSDWANKFDNNSAHSHQGLSFSENSSRMHTSYHMP
ncbi:unnamed protein product [Allacma fusca]|uniref:Uncharacterized protein n=1 Tax=Allacma fusca TaxID=39272 RepID=A0A8J2LFH3_9HEXA|nr:unnamed protein product [Allacma fusca]